jgi:hypothetical protein
MPLNISKIPLRIGIREFRETRQQITDIITLYPFKEQEQKHIY